MNVATVDVIIHCKNKSATMTPFYGANSLCAVDTLFWCQTCWCHYVYNTRNGVMWTLNLVLLLHLVLL